MQLSAARIFVDDLARAKVFYRDALGLRLTRDGTAQGYCSFESAGIHLIIELVAEHAPDEERAMVGRFAGLSFAVDDVHAEHRRLQARGVEFTDAPSVKFWGGTLATFKDPSGNALQLVQYNA